MAFTKKISEYLKSSRIKKGFSQKDMSKILNVKQSTISKYESGKSRIDIETFVKWSNATGSELQAAYVLFGADVINNLSSVISSNVLMFIF